MALASLEIESKNQVDGTRNPYSRDRRLIKRPLANPFHIFSTGTIELSWVLTEPEALADFRQRGSAGASGSMNCIG